MVGEVKGGDLHNYSSPDDLDTEGQLRYDPVAKKIRYHDDVDEKSLSPDVASKVDQRVIAFTLGDAPVTVAYPHGLGALPKSIHFYGAAEGVIPRTQSAASYWTEGNCEIADDGTTFAQACKGKDLNDPARYVSLIGFCIVIPEAGGQQATRGKITAVSTTTYSVAWDEVSGPITVGPLSVAVTLRS